MLAWNVFEACWEFRDFLTEDRWYGILGPTAITNAPTSVRIPRFRSELRAGGCVPEDGASGGVAQRSYEAGNLRLAPRPAYNSGNSTTGVLGLATPTTHRTDLGWRNRWGVSSVRLRRVASSRQRMRHREAAGSEIMSNESMPPALLRTNCGPSSHAP